MDDITPELRVRLEELGYEAATRYAATLNATNAVEFAGETLARQLTRNDFHSGLAQVQMRARLSLFPLAEVSKSQRAAAVNAFVGGLFRFSNSGSR
jgi:hypothetical protein